MVGSHGGVTARAEAARTGTAAIGVLEPGSIVRVFASDSARFCGRPLGCSQVALTGRFGSFMSSERTSRRLLTARPWTDEEDALVLELFRQGKLPIAIAAKLRRTVSAVRSRRDKLLAGQAQKAIGTGSSA